ncbi:hypothetical protein Tco_0606376 [Tanacetum coccineum]
MAGSEDKIPPPPSQTPTQQTPHTVSTIKLPILKKGEYDIWAMKMEHYLAHTDYPIWEVIQRGNGPVSVSTDTNEDHLAKFHKMTDAKETWEAIKSRFGGNDESKKMKKYIIKAMTGVSTEDANQKFLRSLPSAWSQVSLIMRTKPGVDSLSFDDLYNNLRVFESDVKGSTASSSNTHTYVDTWGGGWEGVGGEYYNLRARALHTHIIRHMPRYKVALDLQQTLSCN